VLVKPKGRRDVRLYFDKAGGLLGKREQQVPGPSSGTEVQQVVVFSDYQEKDGLKLYKKIVALRKGKKLISARVTELEFFEKLDAKVLTKP
jgi:hypothetical protein